jgi:hypothetical protein
MSQSVAEHTNTAHAHLPEDGTALPPTTKQTIDYTAEEHEAVWLYPTTTCHP